MANTNSKISTVVSSQLPFFVRNDHPNFVAFLEAYYEYLEQSNNTLQFGKTTERSKNLLNYLDIDNTLDDFSNILYQRFLNIIPKDLKADKKLILKNAKDFYRSTGSEKSIRFLMRVLFNEEIDFYYPKSDVLRASDGKWYIERTLRVTEETINGTANTTTAALEKFVSRRITGNTSNASAKVESVSRFFDKNIRVDELVISEVKGVFKAGETIRAYYDELTETKMVTGRVFGGILNGIKIINPGASYKRGDVVPVVTTDEGAGGAVVYVDKVSTGNISAVTVVSDIYGYIDGGAGYRAGDFLAISDPEGQGANAYIQSANTDETYHQNSYNIYYTTIQALANANIDNINYGLYFTGMVNPSNANTTLANSLLSWQFSNTGPARTIAVTDAGAGYIDPTIGVFGNTAVKSLGILGRMEIINGGTGYAVGDQIEFINYPDTYGYGGRGNVTNVAANGRIQQVKFIPYGEIPGGLGYSYSKLPKANVISATGTGANVIVTAILGTGGTFQEANSIIGRIERLSIITGGSSYTAQNTYIDMTGSGDGTAQLTPVLLEGIITKPGRYINDDGHLSSFNFLQDRDYYQNYSFVIKVKQSIDEYKTILRDLVQPAGTKLFGEHTYVSEIINSQAQIYNTANQSSYRYLTSDNVIYNTANITANIVFSIAMDTTNQAPNSQLYIEFVSGNAATFNANGFYYVKSVTNANSLNVYSGTKLPASYNVSPLGETQLHGMVFGNDGKILYTAGQSALRIMMHDLIYPWDVSSARLRMRSPALSDTIPVDVYIHPAGNTMYIIGQQTKQVRQFSISSGNTWNINAASFITSYNVSAQESIPSGFTFGSNGRFMYVTGTANDRIIMYTLSTPWNVNTAIYTTNLSVTANETQPQGLHFKKDGTQLYFIGDGSKRIHQYTLNTSWNVATATYVARTESFANLDTIPAGITFNDEGSVVYVAGYGTKNVYQFPLAEKWNISTIKVDSMRTTGNSGTLSVTRQVT